MNLYNPAEQSKEWLIEHFVVRTKVFNRIFDDIKTSAMQHPEQHYLIQGQRGMGKTTLLLRLKYEIENTEELKDWLMPVFFNEDSYDLTSLSSLWEKLLKYFDDHLEDGGGYYDATDKFVGSKDYEQQCFNLVTDILHKHKRKIVLLFDNFGELFLDNLKEKEEHRLREILMTSPDIRIIAGSAVVLENTHDYKAPFFDFFKIINLEGLNKEETYDLIKKLQEKNNDPIDVEAHKARIETLTILTGGVIRTIVMLYEILLTDKDGSAIKDLDKILDRVTPLYKHRMEGLKPQQRRIMDVVAKNWDAISTKDIAKNIRDDGQPVQSKVVSAQLQELEKNNFVEKIPTSTKNNLYIVKERFFNIWYLMRHGDKNSQCRVKWLTRFLETWYGDDGSGMEIFINKYIEKLQSGNYRSSSALIVTNALLSSAQTNAVNQALLLHATESVVSEDQVKYLLRSDKRRLNDVINMIESGEYKSAISLLESINPKDSEVVSQLGYAHFFNNDYDKSIYYLSQLPQLDYDTFCNLVLGVAYYRINKYELALKHLLNSEPDYREKVANTIGDIYYENADYDNAEKYFKMFANKNPYSLHRLSRIYDQQKNDSLKAIYYLEKSISLENNHIAWRLLAHLYMKVGKPIEDVEDAVNQSLKLNSEKENEEINKFFLILLYLAKKVNKEKALRLLGETTYINLDKGIYRVKVFIWNNEFEEGIREFIPLIDTVDSNHLEELNDILILLLAKKQYHSTLKIFNNNTVNLKEKLKPTYYALMYLLKDEYPDEYIKMGSELKQPVEDILKEIEQYAIDYV